MYCLSCGSPDPSTSTSSFGTVYMNCCGVVVYALPPGESPKLTPAQQTWVDFPPIEGEEDAEGWTPSAVASHDAFIASKPFTFDCDGCGRDIRTANSGRDLPIVLCAHCNRTPIPFDAEFVIPEREDDSRFEDAQPVNAAVDAIPLAILSATPTYVRLVPGEPTLVPAQRVRAATPALRQRRAGDYAAR